MIHDVTMVEGQQYHIKIEEETKNAEKKVQERREHIHGLLLHILLHRRNKVRSQLSTN